MIDELEKAFHSIGIEIKTGGYYKTFGEVMNELHCKWYNIPLNDKDDFKEEVIRLIEGGGEY